MLLLDMCSKAARLYNRTLQRHPFPTQMVSSGLLWGLGDVLAQRIGGKTSYDSRRGLLTATYGGIAAGPFGHAFYIGLDKIASKFFFPGTTKFIAFKVITDTAVYGPLHVLGYFVFMSMGDGGSWKQAQQKIQQDFWSTYCAEVLFWPPVQAINFKFVPVHYHLMVVNCLMILDSSFMSWASAQDNWLYNLFPSLAQAGAVDKDVKKKSKDNFPTV